MNSRITLTLLLIIVAAVGNSILHGSHADATRLRQDPRGALGLRWGMRISEVRKRLMIEKPRWSYYSCATAVAESAARPQVAGHAATMTLLSFFISQERRRSYLYEVMFVFSPSSYRDVSAALEETFGKAKTRCMVITNFIAENAYSLEYQRAKEWIGDETHIVCERIESDTFGTKVIVTFSHVGIRNVARDKKYIFDWTDGTLPATNWYLYD